MTPDEIVQRMQRIGYRVFYMTPKQGGLRPYFCLEASNAILCHNIGAVNRKLARVGLKIDTWFGWHWIQELQIKQVSNDS